MGEGEVRERAGCGSPSESYKRDCSDAIHQLYDYLDGELTEERRRWIGSHLDESPPCAGAADFEAELRQVIADKCRDHVPDSLRRRVAEAIAGEQLVGTLRGEPGSSTAGAGGSSGPGPSGGTAAPGRTAGT